MAPALETLTEDHAAVYDRQLRVWGVEVQRRLMEAKVLIIGLGGLGAEIAKNIVLAGVGTVALRDDTPATSAAPGNFLVEPTMAEGRSVAEASALTLQAMNPLMAVKVVPGPPHVTDLLPGGDGASDGGNQAESLSSLVSEHDVVVACSLGGLREVAALDELCRARGRQLLAGVMRGPSSFVFLDLGPRHVYTVKGEAGEKVLEYGTFRSAMSADVSALNTRRPRAHPLYLVLRACWEVEEAQSRPAAGPADLPAVRVALERLAAGTAAAKTAASAQDAARALVPDDLLEAFVLDGPTQPPTTSGSGGSGAGSGGGEGGIAVPEVEGGDAPGAGGWQPLGELAPVCAVVGGVVANNVLRAVSHVNPPLRNLFCYSYLARDGMGLEECFM